MTARRFVVGLCVLCWLSLSMFAAQGAVAAIKGTTMFTCKKAAGGAGFSKEHCKSADTVGSGASFQHLAVAQDTQTEVRVTNEGTEGIKTPATLRTTISGIEIELQATSTLGQGVSTNKLDPSTGDHFIHGTGSTTYEGVTVIKPAGCAVESASIVTKELTGTSLGQGMAGKLQPAAGTTAAEFNIIGGSCPEAIKGTYKVTGSITCSGDGSTVICTHAATTEQGTLKVRNQKVGVEVTTTAKGRDVAAGDTEFTPLAVTTVET